jgi:hypothetical protein
MRNFFASIAVIILNIGIGFANVQPEASIEKQNDDHIAINIDLGDLTDKSETEVDNLFNENLASLTSMLEDVDSVEEELRCTVTVRGSVGVGANRIEIEVSVTGPCSKVRAAARKILADVKEMLLD